MTNTTMNDAMKKIGERLVEMFSQHMSRGESVQQSVKAAFCALYASSKGKDGEMTINEAWTEFAGELYDELRAAQGLT